MYKKYCSITKGFTLAEILLTITIIGIIASYTIPGLLLSVTESQLKAAWKKKFSEISEATAQIVSDQENMTGMIPGNTASFRDLYAQKLNIIKNCNWANMKGVCWHQNNEWYSYDGIAPLTLGAISTGEASIMVDGSFITFNPVSSDCSYSAGDPAWSWLGVYKACGWIYIDTNGFKKPNTRGKDIMEIIITKYGAHAVGDYGNGRAPNYEALYLIN